KCARHDDGRRAVAASDIRHSRTVLQLRDDAVERRQPALYEMADVCGSKKSFSTSKQLGIVFSPEHSLAGFEVLFNAGLRLHHGIRDLKPSTDKKWTVFICQCESMFSGQNVSRSRRIIFNITACRLINEPFSNIAFGCMRLTRQLLGRNGT